MDGNIKEKQEMTSHKIIEKRRRDRINNCLLELNQAVPAAFSKQTPGKLEKAEILEMTVEYLRAVHKTQIGQRLENGEWYSCDIGSDFLHHYQAGYSDCMKEVIRFLSQIEGVDVNRILTFLQSRFRPEKSVTSCVPYRNLASGTSKESFTCGQISTESRNHFRLPTIQPYMVIPTRPSVIDSIIPGSPINQTASINIIPHPRDSNLRGCFTVPQPIPRQTFVNPVEAQRYISYHMPNSKTMVDREDRSGRQNENTIWKLTGL